jgi:dTDP-D-glucose 4,6-dehydratase
MTESQWTEAFSRRSRWSGPISTGRSPCWKRPGGIAWRGFLHISTDEVYGSTPAPAGYRGVSAQPGSPYSASKAGSDLLARSYFVTFGLPVVIRASNDYGPFQFPES